MCNRLMEKGSPIDTVSRFIICHFHPDKIILFSQKKDLSGNVTSFKLCIVSPTDNKGEIERSVYLQADCEIPFDLLIYTREEWEQLADEVGSFAWKLDRTGLVIYE